MTCVRHPTTPALLFSLPPTLNSHPLCCSPSDSLCSFLLSLICFPTHISSVRLRFLSILFTVKFSAENNKNSIDDLKTNAGESSEGDFFKNKHCCADCNSDLLNQNLRVWGPEVDIFTGSPGDPGPSSGGKPSLPERDLKPRVSPGENLQQLPIFPWSHCPKSLR